MDFNAEWAYVDLGAFEYQANPWNKGNLVHGRDFTQRLTVTPDREALRLEWVWPADGSDIVAYPGLILGMKPWSDTSTSASFPVRISEIDNLTADIDLNWFSPPGANFNVAFDLWIASADNNEPGVILSELMIWVKTWEWETSPDVFARYSDSNGPASIYYRPDHSVGDDGWAYMAVVYKQNVTEGQIDLGDLLRQLIELGIVNPNHLLMDIELGAEVVGGAGALDVRDLTISLNGQSQSVINPENLSLVEAGSLP